MLHGAKGNGSNDDTGAINEAITTAGAGGTVYFPNGTYMIGAAGLILSASVKFLGASTVGTILKQSATSTNTVSTTSMCIGSATLNAFVQATANNIEFENLTIDANSNATFALAVPSTLSGIKTTKVTCKGGVVGFYTQNVSNITVDNCSFILNSLHQLLFTVNTGGTMANVNVSNSLFDPLGANAGATIATVSCWICNSYKGTGSSITCHNNTINYASLGATVESDGFVATAVNTGTVTGVSVSGGTITMTSGMAVSTYSNGHAAELSSVTDYTVNGVVVVTGSQIGITCEKTADSGIVPTGTITGNCISGVYGASGYPTAGIKATSGNANITGNYIENFDCQIYGNCDATNIVANVVQITNSGSANQGISYYCTGNDTGSSISDNMVLGASNAGGYCIGIFGFSSTACAYLNISNNFGRNAAYGLTFFTNGTATSTNVIGNNFYNVATPIYQPPTGALIISQSSGALQLNNYTTAGLLQNDASGKVTTLAASTGYGTPTNGAKQSSFDATSITLPNLAAAVAQLIVDLKADKILAA
jgi:hypothetical protein